MMNEQELSPEVFQLLADGRKIEAIKLIREETGLGLKEAKDLAEALLGEHAPTESAPPPITEQGGASGMIAIIIAVVIAYLVYVFFLSD